MNILIYNWKDVRNPNVGGAELITFEMARRLAREGHRVAWFCREFPGCKKEEEIDQVKVVRRGGTLTTYLYGWRYYSALKTKPDIVIDMVNTLAWQTPIYARKSRRTVYVNQLAREVFFYEMSPAIGWIPYLLENVEYQTYRNIPALCYSQSTEDDLVSVGLKRDKMHRFLMGLDHDRYVPGTKSATPLFICVSRLAKMKRVDLSIKGFAIATKDLPEARLAVFGYGPDEGRLRKLVKNLGVEKKVLFAVKDHPIFKDPVKDPKVDYMQRSWALLTPSVKEGWCMTVTEANACGTLAIGARVSGLQDSIRHDETGVLLPKNPTPEEMAKAITRVIEDEEYRQRLSSQAIKWAQTFSWDKCFETFKEALEEATKTKL